MNRTCPFCGTRLNSWNAGPLCWTCEPRDFSVTTHTSTVQRRTTQKFCSRCETLHRGQKPLCQACEREIMGVGA